MADDTHPRRTDPGLESRDRPVSPRTRYPRPHPGEDDVATRLAAAVPSMPRLLKYAIAITVAVLWIVPFLGLFMASFRPLGEILAGWWHVEE